MSEDDIIPTDDAIELSDEELEQIDGGVSFRLFGTRFSRNRVSISQNRHSRASIGSPAFESESIESTAFQLTVIDATTEDLKVLGELLGGTDAIEGFD
ncbi:hypothetical protein ACQ4M3_38175 [Leptolyngbya sp. AN03gr2]|uniref:hypothetical protein n=1 Tax=unclassified Leptolyngbya TaxID=2650499 RepID=UPI003D31830B